MTAHLLALAIGPVQEFIAAARRTRDLWFGSHLLSEISKAAARAVHRQGGKLIFPAPVEDADLDPGSAFNVANVILAELSDGDPATVAAEAKAAARQRWRDFADQVFDAYRGVIRPDIWHDQSDDVVEFYAAWHPRSPQDYRADRATVMRLLAARKRCRDFLPGHGRAGVWKSSLDGARESVLRPAREWGGGSKRALRLQEGEQLDCPGLVKRAWQPEDGRRSYPSVARIAAEPWIAALKESQIDLAPLVAACRALGRDVVREFDTTEEQGLPQYKPFPFEGTVLFRSRHLDLCSEAGIRPDHPAFARLVSALDAASRAARETGLPREPDPYLGVLVADGDRIGAALSALPTSQEHRRLSQALAEFAATADRIVRAHRGVLVYSGGDDVLALVPADRCLACARHLHEEFGQVLAQWSTAECPLTLSVGIAIAHFMEPLEDLIGYGRAAEKHAKRPRDGDIGQVERNGLALHLVKRRGGPVGIRANWSADPRKDPSQNWQQLGEWIAARSVPGRVAYDLHRLARVYEAWPSASVRDAIRRDVLAVMQGKEPRGASRMEDIKDLILGRVENADTLRGLANELLVAKAIAFPRNGTSAAASP